MTDAEMQMAINKEHDDRTRRDRIVGVLICLMILLWTFAFCGTHPDPKKLPDARSYPPAGTYAPTHPRRGFLFQ
jgi:hypothetical protein